MRTKVKTHLPSDSAPIEWATRGGNVVYTAQIPVREDGSIEDGSIATQTHLTLQNLKRTIEAAGGSLDDVTQVLVYLTDKSDFSGMNEVYKTYFTQPYPNRATVIAGLMVPGARIEIVAHAHLES